LGCVGLLLTLLGRSPVAGGRGSRPWHCCAEPQPGCEELHDDAHRRRRY
jgi:hypothetical protein